MVSQASFRVTQLRQRGSLASQRTFLLRHWLHAMESRILLGGLGPVVATAAASAVDGGTRPPAVDTVAAAPTVAAAGPAEAETDGDGDGEGGGCGENIISMRRMVPIRLSPKRTMGTRQGAGRFVLGSRRRRVPFILTRTEPLADESPFSSLPRDSSPLLLLHPHTLPDPPSPLLLLSGFQPDYKPGSLCSSDCGGRGSARLFCPVELVPTNNEGRR